MPVHLVDGTCFRTFTAPNHISMDLPNTSMINGSAFGVSSARYTVRHNQSRGVLAFSAQISLEHDAAMGPRVEFSIEFERDQVMDSHEIEYGKYDRVGVQRLGQTRNGLSILLVERTDGWPMGGNMMVSSLTEEDLRSANNQIRRVDLWRSQWIDGGHLGAWQASAYGIEIETRQKEALMILTSIR